MERDTRQFASVAARLTERSENSHPDSSNSEEVDIACKRTPICIASGHDVDDVLELPLNPDVAGQVRDRLGLDCGYVPVLRARRVSVSGAATARRCAVGAASAGKINHARSIGRERDGAAVVVHPDASRIPHRACIEAGQRRSTGDPRKVA